MSSTRTCTLSSEAALAAFAVLRGLLMVSVGAMRPIWPGNGSFWTVGGMGEGGGGSLWAVSKSRNRYVRASPSDVNPACKLQ